MLSLQYCKLKRKSKESAQEWMGRLHNKATDCKYQENDRRLKEQFKNDLNGGTILAKLIKELKVLRDKSKVSNKQVLMWAQRVKSQRVQKAVLGNIWDVKVFNSITRQRQN